MTPRRARFECRLALAVVAAGSVACAPDPAGGPIGGAATDARPAGAADGSARVPVLTLVNWRCLTPGQGEPVPVFDVEKSLNLTAVSLRTDAPGAPDALVPLDARFELVVDGVAVPLSVRIRGPHVALTPERGAPVGNGTLSARGTPEAPVQQWAIRLRPAQDARPEVAAALEACRAGRAETGLETLARAVAAEPASDVHWLLVEQARCLQGASRLDEALTAWIRAAESAAQAGLPTEEARRLRAAAFVAIQVRRFGEARGLLDRTDALDALPGPPRWRNRAGEARTLYYRGLLEGESGNLRGAVEATRAAVSAFEALGLFSDAAMAREWLVYQHQRAGSDREALTLLATIEREDEPKMRPADRARFLHNRAWFHAAAMERGVLPRDDAAVRRAFEDARALFSTLGQTAAVAEADVNLAWMELRAGEPLAAERRLAALDRLPGGAAAYSADFRRLLRGEIALAFGRADEARRIFEASARRALEEAPGQEPEERWRALHGLGRAYERLGRPARADVAYREALAALEGVGRRTLLRSVRTGFFDARHALVEDALRLALSRQDARRVFEVVLRSQARLLGDLEASVRPARLSPEVRKVWDARVEAWARARQAFEDGRAEGDLLPARALAGWRAERARAGLALTAAYDAAWSVLDEAAPPAPEASSTPSALSARLGAEAALLDFFRLDGAIHALQIDGQGLRLHRPQPEDLLAGVTLAPTVKRLYVVPGEVAAARALPVQGRLGGRPLAEVAAVALLPHAGLLGVDRPAAVGGPVLLVADPSGNLPVARREALRLQGRYPSARLLLGNAARRTEVLDALRDVSLFHFAGHGVTHPDDPWAAHLALAEEQTLTLEDVLVAGMPAALVVLSGCETGASVPVGDRNGVGLAEAFLAAGARTVLATERPVGDVEAGAFVARFHDALATTDPGGAWQAATRADPAGSDAFRLFGALEAAAPPR